MKSLFVKLNCPEEPNKKGLNIFGFDIIWSDPNLEYIDFVNHNHYDELGVTLAETSSQRLLVEGANVSPVGLLGEFELCRLNFRFKNGIESKVPITIDNLTAFDADGKEVSLLVNSQNYDPAYHSVIDLVWK